MSRKILALFAIALFLAPVTQDFEEKVEKIFQSIETSKGQNVESAIRDLIDLGPGAMDSVKKGFTRADQIVRVAAASYAFNFKDHDEALEVFLSLCKDAKLSSTSRLSARLLSTFIQTQKFDKDTSEAYSKQISTTISKAKDDIVKVNLLKISYNLTESLSPKRDLRSLFKKADSKEIKDEAALALAEIEDSTSEVYLKELAKEPSDKGKLAKSYSEILRLKQKLATAAFSTGEINRLNKEVKKLEDDKIDLQKEIKRLKDRIKELEEKKLEKPEKSDKPQFPPLPNEEEDDRYKILDEIIDMLKKYYVNPDKVDVKLLIEKAAKGMLNSLDPYSTYYEEKEYEKMRKEEMEGKYGGIGARVGMRRDRNGNTWLTITEPFFASPAFKAGLRAYDRIVEINGEPTANQDLDELVRRLRGTPDSAVKIKYQRYGFEKPKELEIVRKEIKTDAVYHEMLPGDIGFLRLTRFGTSDDKSMKKAIESLKDKDMKALILDLRGNPGGSLSTCLNMIDLFLAEGNVSVIIKTRGEEDKRMTRTPALTDVPMVILIDGGSASASEILSGALKFHGRAKIIGEKSYGKGTVQQTIDLRSNDKKSAIKFTVSKWLLPGGDPVDNEDKSKAGVKPDIEVLYPEREPYIEKALEKLREDLAVEKYLKEHFDGNKELFEKLAMNDKKDTSKYPKFDDFYNSLNTKAEKDWVRKEVRDFIRQKVAEERQVLFLTDTQDDPQLQRSIVEIGKMAKLDLSKIEEYAYFLKNSQN